MKKILFLFFSVLFLYWITWANSCSITSNCISVEVLDAKKALWNKASIFESLVPLFKAKDQATQDRVKALLDTFKLSKDSYTRNIGIYFWYLVSNTSWDDVDNNQSNNQWDNQWTLKWNNNWYVEYTENHSARNIIFDGTYTASKQDVYLNEFAVMSDVTTNWNIKYFLSIDGKEVWSFYHQANSSSLSEQAFIDKYWENFSNVLVEKGEKVSIKLEANVYWATANTYTNTLIIWGVDKNNNNVWLVSSSTSKIKIVPEAKADITDSITIPRESVEIADSNVTIARFVARSSRNLEGVTLNYFTLSPTNSSSTKFDSSNIRVRVAWRDIDSSDVVVDGAGKLIVSNIYEEIPLGGLDVEVLVKKATEWEYYKYTLTDINGSNPWTKFSKKILASIASIKSQENRWDSTTKFTFSVDKDDTDTPIRDLVLFVKDNGIYESLNSPLSVEEGTTLEVTNYDKVRFIEAIWWNCSDTTRNNCSTLIEKSEFPDFFRIGDSFAHVYRTK